MHSYIISGGTAASREENIVSLTQTWQVSPFDCVRIEAEDESIGVAQIRSFITNLQLKPRQSPLHAGIIAHAELLTVTAQQALLKTLEEPPQTVRLILGVPNTSLLLPTIISRCQVISLTSQLDFTQAELDDCWKLLTELSNTSIGSRINICANLGKTKEELSLFLSRAIAATRHHMLTKNDTAYTDATLLHRLLAAKKYEGTNANLQLFIEHIFIGRNDVNIM